MTYFEEEEYKLSEKLRSICDSEGREISPEESGQVFNKLGLLYKTKSPDKISLIQSAALMNAAIARQPLNKKFQRDLEDLCKHVLECARAKEEKLNLIDISKQVKKSFVNLRKDVEKKLEIFTPINKGGALEAMKDFFFQRDRFEQEERKTRAVKIIQDYISQKYTSFMSFISQHCIEIMGKPPCNYALVGMGSLARKEITPYSDFEHIIVLENLRFRKHHKQTTQSCRKYPKHILTYFRWYSVIFHIIVINLQETIIPSISIQSLNDSLNSSDDWYFDKITTRGVSFDGMMPHACKFPLGRAHTTPDKPFSTELIKPVSEMVKYLNVEEALKNGYHLADILMKTCFVAGSENVYQIFCKKINKIRQQQSEEMHLLIKAQLKEDLENFNIANSLKTFESSQSLNIKHVIYRSVSLFISALGQLNNCNKTTNFAILEELFQEDILDASTFHALSSALATACLLRLHWYIMKEAQNDYVPEYSTKFFRSDRTNFFLAVVSRQELAKFFSTVLRLQMTLADHEILNIEKHFNKSNVWPELAAKMFMGLYKEVIHEGEHYLHKQIDCCQTNEDVLVYRYVVVAHLENAPSIIHFFTQLSKSHFSGLAKLHQTIASSIKWNKPPKDVLHQDIFLKVFDSVLKLFLSHEFFDDSLPDTLTRYCCGFLLSGYVFAEIRRYHEALRFFRKCFYCFKLNANEIENIVTLFRAFALPRISLCLLRIGYPNKALHYAFECIELLDQHMFGSLIQLQLQWQVFDVISKCYLKLGYENQQERYQKMSEISRNFVSCRDLIKFIEFLKVVMTEIRKACFVIRFTHPGLLFKCKN